MDHRHLVWGVVQHASGEICKDISCRIARQPSPRRTIPKQCYCIENRNRSNLMTNQVERRLLRRVSISIPAILLAAGMLAALSSPCLADEAPKPDPSGITTGDKTAAVDAAGNSFVVAEPTDK